MQVGLLHTNLHTFLHTKTGKKLLFLRFWGLILSIKMEAWVGIELFLYTRNTGYIQNYILLFIFLAASDTPLIDLA